MTEAETSETIEGVQIPSLLNRKIDNGRFLLLKCIGNGGYSTVYLARDLLARPGSREPTQVAIKCVLHYRKLRLEREVALHDRASASIPGVIKLYRTFEEGGLFFMVLEHCPHGDLFSVITETSLFIRNDELIRTVFLQLLDIVAALHRIGIYHRDLKPENVLCLNSPKAVSNGKASMLHVLLADFGLATEAEHSKSFGCGSYFYMTPECLAGAYSTGVTAYSSRATDIWALGIILVNIICGRSPWKTAMLSDPSFKRFADDHTWLRRMLPISLPAYEFLSMIFVNHGNNVRFADLRKKFCKIKTFYMSENELAVSGNPARLLASEWIPHQPIQDIRTEDIRDYGSEDYEDLFDDALHVPHSNSEASSEFELTRHSSVGRTPFAPAGVYDTADSGPESSGPVTPETNATKPPDGIPELLNDKKPISDNGVHDWGSAMKEIHGYRKVLTAQALQNSPLVGRFVL